MSARVTGLAATTRAVAADVRVGHGTSIVAREATIAPGVRIGAGVQIVCDGLHLGEGSTIGDDVTIVAPTVTLGERCTVKDGVVAELNDVLHLGACSAIGRATRMAGQGVIAGEHLHMKDEVIIGGGGAYGPTSYLRIGSRTTIVDRGFLNISEAIDIGDDCALSINVVVLTHGAWQSALQGFPTRFAPVAIGDHTVAYANAVILPGVTIGAQVTVGAGSVVRDERP